ncbi:hypothetical protein HK405_011091 [Cladochytrium tenue]|nr:hypothetical protein HK405_011091 [Cladochytrium tenue]
MQQSSTSASGAAGAAGSDQSRSALLPVDARAAASWSAAEHNSRIDDRDRDRFFGATDAFEESLYMLPADADEKVRLHLQHVVLRTTFGGNFHTPQRDLFADDTVSAKILDVGCGTGSWCIDMAKQFPHADVTGIDLVSYERTEVPDNLTFEMGNVLEGLKYPDNTFDFVHQRLLIFALPKDSIPSVFKELVRVTKPGGYIQVNERLKRSERAALILNLIGWNGPIGKLFLSDTRKLFNGMKPFLMRAIGVTDEEFAQLLDEAVDQCGLYLIFE